MKIPVPSPELQSALRLIVDSHVSWPDEWDDSPSGILRLEQVYRLKDGKHKLSRLVQVHSLGDNHGAPATCFFQFKDHHRAERKALRRFLSRMRNGAVFLSVTGDAIEVKCIHGFRTSGELVLTLRYISRNA